MQTAEPRLHMALFVCILGYSVSERGVVLAVYICTNQKCLFTFERTGPVDACPDCGSVNVRFADDGEIKEYRRNRDEASADKSLMQDKRTESD